MQIYEIFHENILKGVTPAAPRPAPVAGPTAPRNFVQRMPDVLGAIGQNIGSKILTKAGLPGDAGLGTDNPFGNKEAEARKATAKTVQVQAEQLFKKWVEAAKTNQGFPTNAMSQSVKSMVLNTLLRRQAGSEIDGMLTRIDKVKQPEAQKLIQQIETSMASMTDKQAKDSFQDWYAIVNSANELNHLAAFHPRSYQDYVEFDGQQYRSGNRILNPNNKEDQAIIQRAIQNKRFKTASTTAATTAGVPQGKRIVVQDPKTAGTYYKTSTGWTNEIGQPVNPGSVAYLDQLADQSGREENIPSPVRNASRVAKAARQGVRNVR